MTVITTISEARAAVAAVLSDVAGIGTVLPAPDGRAPVTRTGWITIGRVAPAGFLGATVELVAWIWLGQAEAEAEAAASELAVPILTALRQDLELPAGDLTVQPAVTQVGSAPVYAVQAILTIEI